MEDYWKVQAMHWYAPIDISRNERILQFYIGNKYY